MYPTSSCRCCWSHLIALWCEVLPNSLPELASNSKGTGLSLWLKERKAISHQSKHVFPPSPHGCSLCWIALHAWAHPSVSAKHSCWYLIMVLVHLQDFPVCVLVSLERRGNIHLRVHLNGKSTTHPQISSLCPGLCDSCMVTPFGAVCSIM